jgi:hypothetical protein
MLHLRLAVYSLGNPFWARRGLGDGIGSVRVVGIHASPGRRPLFGHHVL